MILRDHIWLLWEWSEDAYLAEDLLARAAATKVRARAFKPEEFFGLKSETIVVNPPHLLWDRAGDVFPEACRIADWAEAAGALAVNPVRGARMIHRKDRLHKLLVESNLPVPQTVVLRNHADPDELNRACGKYLVLKPALSGGGEGVRIQCWDYDSLKAEIASRPTENWLLQEYIEPARIAGRAAWFRVFYLLGDVRVCWWDHKTHIYELIPCEELERLGFNDLKNLGRKIASCIPMQFFSAEIAYRANGKPVVVDYINDPCDLRSKKRIPNGVPEELLDWVFGRIFEAALRRT